MFNNRLRPLPRITIQPTGVLHKSKNLDFVFASSWVDGVFLLEGGSTTPTTTIQATQNEEEDSCNSCNTHIYIYISGRTPTHRHSLSQLPV